MLEPRRVAARAAATRMAEERGEQVGDTIGLRTRTTHGCPQSPVSRSSPRACSPACCSTIRHLRVRSCALRRVPRTVDSHRHRPGLPPRDRGRPAPRSADRGHVGHAQRRTLAARLRTDAVVKVEAERHPVTVSYRPPEPGEDLTDAAATAVVDAVGSMPTPVICSSFSRGSVPLLVSNGPYVGPLAVVSMATSS